MKRFDWNGASTAARAAALARPGASDRLNVDSAVRAILNDVRAGGDRAVRMWTARLDGFDGPVRPVAPEAFDEAWATVDAELHAALDVAVACVATFHEPQLPEPIVVETIPGVSCRRVARPLRTVGLYVPGGRAPLPSTAIMLGIPARIAGCQTRFICTPPRADGSVDPTVLVSARKVGIDTVYTVGGAQAVAAMAYGTESIPRCNKIFGPGNRFVNAAKQIVAADPDGAAIDLPAGPSEVLVLADETADPLLVAADLLAQAEHDVIAHVVLATTSPLLASDVDRLLPRLADALPDATTARAALEAGVVVLADDESDLVEIANAYAPEHLIINTHSASEIADAVDVAGSVFVGPWTPEVLGDYCSGTNHVLPTSGFARAHSGLSVEDFMRFMTVQEATADGFAALGPVAASIARAEGLIAHERSVLARLRQLESHPE